MNSQSNKLLFGSALELDYQEFITYLEEHQDDQTLKEPSEPKPFAHDSVAEFKSSVAKLVMKKPVHDHRRQN